MSIVADIQLGKMLSAEARHGPNQRPYLRNINVRWGSIDVDDVLTMSFSREQVEKFSLRRGDLLVCEGGEPGRAAVWEDQLPGALYQKALHRVRPQPGILSRYLQCYLMWSAQVGALARSFTGSTIKHLPKEVLEECLVPLPPPQEQQRIVSTIEEAFSEIESGVNGLDVARARLVHYRAAVLKAACEGRLVPTEAELARAEGRGYESGEVVVARAKAARLHHSGTKARQSKRAKETYVQSKPELPEGWTWARWEEIGVSQDGRPFPSADYCDDGVRLLRPGNLAPDGRVVWTEKNTRFLPKDYAETHGNLIIGERELIINLTAQSLEDEFLGRVCLTRPGDPPALLNQRLARLTSHEIEREYLLCVFRSGIFRSFVDPLNTGSMIQHMFTSQLAHFELPIPPVAEQHRIVAEVDRRLSVVEQLEAAIDRSLQRAARLRQSILKQAFEGKLVPQDPDDEPASVLLERIRKEREMMASAVTGKEPRTPHHGERRPSGRRRKPS